MCNKVIIRKFLIYKLRLVYSSAADRPHHNTLSSVTEGEIVMVALFLVFVCLGLLSCIV